MVDKNTKLYGSTTNGFITKVAGTALFFKTSYFLKSSPIIIKYVITQSCSFDRVSVCL